MEIQHGGWKIFIWSLILRCIRSNRSICFRFGYRTVFSLHDKATYEICIRCPPTPPFKFESTHVCDEKLQIENDVLKGVGHLLWTRNNKQLVVSSRSSNISKYRFISQKWKRKSKLIIRSLHTLYRKMNRTTCNRTRSTFFSDFSFWLHRCWWRVLGTKCVRDRFKSRNKSPT